MELDLRKQRILQAIVQDYVTTAEPVGSQVLVERYSLGVKSATIRNEMAELSERGYLRQPYTSAGRVPSDRGYRFYVNRLMQLPVIQEDETVRIRRAIESTSSEMEAILRRTCQLLAEMTRLPAVVTPPDADTTELRQVFVTPAGARKTLMVLLFSTGRTESRLLELGLTASTSLLLANALNERWTNTALSVLRTSSSSAEFAPAEISRLGPEWSVLCSEIVAAARTIGSETTVYIEGAHAVLHHPEFRQVEKLSHFLETLQERAALLEMLGRALNDERRVTVQVAIGEEMGRPELFEYSMVTSPYFVGGKESGSIGVLGPTRMDYSRASASVDLMARTVGELLTRLSAS